MAYFASTEHLNLRELREDDTDRLFNLRNDPVVQRGPGYVVPMGPGIRKSLANIADAALIYIIIESKTALEEPVHADRKARRSGAREPTADDLFAGMVCLRTISEKNRDAYLVIGLTTKWRGRGYGTEVMRWLVDYAFSDLALHRMSLRVMADNYPAIALYKSVGFADEGRVRKAVFENGAWTDIMYMGLLYEDWVASRSASSRPRREAPELDEELDDAISLGYVLV